VDNCGIDLHLKSSEVYVVDESGEASERARVPTTEASLRRWFGGRAPMRICIEASGLSPWVGRVLTELGHEVIVANAQRVRLIAESTLKNDKVDAETLARLVRMDPALLCPIRHRSEETQRLRGMLRVRRALINSRTTCLNTARGLLRSFGHRVPGRRPERLARALTTGKVPEELCALVAPLVATALELDEKVQALDGEVIELGRGFPEVERFQQVPGIGPLVALAFVLCIEDPRRFRSSRDIPSFLGLRPRMRESAERSHFGSITRQGDAEMRRLLVQAAHGCLRSHQDTDLKRWAEELAGRIGKKKAVVALARKLAVVLHHLWVSGEDYQALRQAIVAAA
jgi:transposase